MAQRCIQRRVQSKKNFILDDFCIFADVAPITAVVAVLTAATETKKQKKANEVAVVQPQQKRHRSKANATATKSAPQPKSGYYGVGASGSKWQAQISYGGKQHYRGSFNTKEEAAATYDEAVRENRPDCPLNFTSAKVAAAAVQVAVPERVQQAALPPAAKVKVRLPWGVYHGEKVAGFLSAIEARGTALAHST